MNFRKPKSFFKGIKYKSFGVYFLLFLFSVFVTTISYSSATNYVDPLNYPAPWPGALNGTTALNALMTDVNTTGGVQDNSNGGTTPNGNADFSGTGANAASFFSGDGKVMFIRYRLNGDPSQTTGVGQPF
ncbi:MAG: hypothetical protein H7263_19125, partial [Candidatus Sericytochromatia bacterium]|nr:hypothetical protein [Candidatus Sericytochromatia bacterium]